MTNLEPIDATQDCIELVRSFHHHDGARGSALLAKYKVESGANGALVGALLGMSLSFGQRLANASDVPFEKLLDDVMFNAIAMAEDDDL